MKTGIPSNAVIDKLPKHLRQYIHPQHYERYTAIDQAVWRYAMRRNVTYLSKVAHHSYLDGLRMTGISLDRIPDMYGMNRILKEIGWAAVAVDGFIPPSAFMEFQAFNVLVIASDIRQLDHIQYTPAPDIIHEAAGHAPIIANPEYAEYLRRFGEIGSKAISSAHDWDVYEAVRKLSQLKEQSQVDASELKAAEERVISLQEDPRALSEMAQIKNLHWWTVEYGLIGQLTDYKIYGAGLLSSIGESHSCMSEQVKKIPYTCDAAQQTYDITKPQPQLFVTPDFSHLSFVLEEFANTMALRTGGMKGLQQVIESKSLATIELSTGLQISGVFDRMIKNDRNRVAFFHATGPTALSHENSELISHSISHHADGFGSPMGRLVGINLAIEDMSPRDLEAYDIYEGRRVTLDFEGGIRLVGTVITGTRNLKGKILLIAFKDCVVTHGEELLYKTKGSELYHMAVGKKISSAFAGPADCESFDTVTHTLSTSESNSKVDINTEILIKEYERISKLEATTVSIDDVSDLHHSIRHSHPTDWLSHIELLEMAKQMNWNELCDTISQYLKQLALQQPQNNQMIESSLDMILNDPNLVYTDD